MIAVDSDKIAEYLTDMIAYFSRMENKSCESEDQEKYRYARYTLEAQLKQVEEGVFS